MPSYSKNEVILVRYPYRETREGRYTVYSQQGLESPVSREPVIQRSPDALRGTAVFQGTRGPARAEVQWANCGLT